MIIIAANKCDLVNEYQVSIEEVEAWAHSFDYKLFVTSACTGQGISELFHYLCEELYQNRKAKNANIQRSLKSNTGSGCC